MTPLVIDNFAGGGGASTGIERALGRAVDVAINHDAEAVAMHVANHPATRHFCQSIMAVDPLDATGGAPVALAWFSPDCKHHSKAKGGKPVEKGIRDLAWIVVHWIERLQRAAKKAGRSDWRRIIRVIALENVEEFLDWGPLTEDDRPDKDRRGETYNLWAEAIRRLGGRIEWRKLRACDYGAPTSRLRLFVVIRFDGLPIAWPQPTHGKPGSAEVLAGTRLPWRTAAECIDWSIACPSIFTRARPLKPATLRRIAHGVMRYVVHAAEPFVVGVGGRRGQSPNIGVDRPYPTTTAKGDSAVVDAAIVPITHSGEDGRAHNPAEPLRTITTANGGEFARVTATVAPLASAPDGPPAFYEADDDDQGDSDDARLAGRGADVSARCGPYADRGRQVERSGQGRAAEPAGVRGAFACGRDGAGAAAAFVGQHNFDRVGRSAGEPLTTTTVRGTQQRLTLAAMAPLQNGERRAGEKPREQDVRSPLSTIATGGKHAAVTAFLSHFYTSSTNGGQGDPRRPAKAITAEGQHHAVVCAHMEQANSGGVIGHAMREPVSTVTSSGAQQRLVETTLIEADALPPDQLARAVQVAAFLVKYYGNEADGHSLDAPIGTVTTKERFAVVTVTIDAVTYVIVDIGMRMLTPRELARAQGFPDSYVLDPIGPNGKPLTKSAQIRMIGNSVCPDVAAAIVAANVALSESEEVAA